MELNVFLASDHTNWNEWIADVYTCVNFTLDLVANARAQNIDAWIVGVKFENSDTGHAFVAFQTTDRGEVWIEPQSDYSYYAVKVGSLLCYAVDTSICDDSGKVSEVVEHLECDLDTDMCWLP